MRPLLISKDVVFPHELHALLWMPLGLRDSPSQGVERRLRLSLRRSTDALPDAERK